MGRRGSPKPTEAEEREVVDAIVDTVKKADKSIAFLRIDTWFADGTEKVLSTVPYDPRPWSSTSPVAMMRFWLG